MKRITELNVFDQKKKQEILSWIILLFSFLIIHFIANPIFGDEVGFRKGILQYNYNIFSYIFQRYFTWSSRFFLDFFMLSLPSLPILVWKALDLSVIALCFYILSKLSKSNLTLALLLCTYPFMHMASAGWIATTTIYLWPFTAAITAFYLLYRKSDKEKKIVSIFYFLLVLYATNNEIIAFLYLCALILYRFSIRKQEILSPTKRLWIIISLGISCLGIMNTLLCPGNSIRLEEEIPKWMPNFRNLSLLDKIRICVVSTMQHFTSLPNVIFILFSFLLSFIAWKKTKSTFEKILIPLSFLISAGISLYFFFTNIVINKNLKYLLPSVKMSKGTAEYNLQIILLVLSILYLFSVIATIFILYRDTQKAIIMECIYLGGLASRFALMFSPTMLASGTRIYFIFYMSMIWLTNDLIPCIKKPSFKKLCYLTLILGVLLNLIMVSLLQHKFK